MPWIMVRLRDRVHRTALETTTYIRLTNLGLRTTAKQEERKIQRREKPFKSSCWFSPLGLYSNKNQVSLASRVPIAMLWRLGGVGSNVFRPSRTAGSRYCSAPWESGSCYFSFLFHCIFFFSLLGAEGSFEILLFTAQSVLAPWQQLSWGCLVRAMTQNFFFQRGSIWDPSRIRERGRKR